MVFLENPVLSLSDCPTDPPPSAVQTEASEPRAGRETGKGYQGFQIHGVLGDDANRTQRKESV
jgi:hypothetical protein